MSIIELKNVSKVYKIGDIEFPALQNINLKIQKGDFVAIVGASGSGKSTMMNMIGCLDIPTNGEIYLEKHNILELEESQLAMFRGKKIGFIFQQYNLIERLTALENVLLPLEFQDINDQEAQKRALKVLKLVNLEDKQKNLPNQLSGGQQQRVSIARSLATNPELILADEPTGALDSKTGLEVLKTLKNLWKEGKTIIMITHDLNLAKYARKIIELKDGKIIKEYENKGIKKND